MVKKSTSESTEENVILYSDGACIGNPGPGGYAALVKVNYEELVIQGGFSKTTNNRMELLAVIEGLTLLDKPATVTVYSDSRYLVETMQAKKPIIWKESAWKRGKKVIPNSDLWEHLLQLCSKHTVYFKWVRGHAGNPYNEKVNKLAQRASLESELPQDIGYLEDLTVRHRNSNQLDLFDLKGEIISSPNLLNQKILKEGQSCRKCGSSVVKVFPKRKIKPGQKYYYEYYLSCPACGTIYLVDEAKRDHPDK